MIEVSIPGFTDLKIQHLVLDVNGTLAADGILLEGVAERLKALSEQVEVHMLTADTHGKQSEIDAQLGLKAQIIQQGSDKERIVGELDENTVVAMGNGANDAKMLELAALGVAVIGPEGAAGVLIRNADVITTDICAALDLLLYPNRLRATLRR